MEWVIFGLFLLAIIFMILSIFISRRFSMIVFIVVFLAGSTYMAITSDRENVVVNILVVGLVLTVGWLKLNKSIADTASARTQMLDRLSRKNYTICKNCGSQLIYHRKPKNLHQLMLGGLSCPNCGAEFDIPFDAILSR